jgi:hypothetical protein
VRPRLAALIEQASRWPQRTAQSTQAEVTQSTERQTRAMGIALRPSPRALDIA